MCGSRKYPYPPRKGSDFPGGGGVNLPNFPVGRGVTIGKYFQRVLVTRKRVTKKKHKNLPRQFICEDMKHDESWRATKYRLLTDGLMDIANIFFQSLGVTSLAKTFPTVCRFRTDLVSVWTAWGIRSKTIVIRSSGFGYLFGKNCHPFERLGLSVWKKLSSVRTAWDILLKKLLSVQTARAICSKKNLSTVRATEAICSKINFSRVSIPKPFRR